MSTFILIDDAALVAAIARCRRRLAYVAPGVTKAVAEAIGHLYERRDVPAITVIIDCDPEVCRLGYGSAEGLQILHTLVERHQFGLRAQPGLRIGVLASDDELLVYAPTPQLIEAGSTSAQKPNAIAIGRDPLTQVLNASAAEGSPGARLPSSAQVGRAAVTPDMLDATLRDLERIPPKAFDVSRVERVFNTRLQYVEIEVTGYRLQARKVAIPGDLLLGEDAELEKRLHNSYALLKDKQSLQVEIEVLDPKDLSPALDTSGKAVKLRYSEAQLEADRKRLYSDFLTQVGAYGWLIRRWDRKAFDLRVSWFRQRIEAYREGIATSLKAAVRASVEDLAAALLPKIKDRVPYRLRKRFVSAELSEAELLVELVQELESAFDRSALLVDPKIKVEFKDLTYETIMDPKFREALDKAYGRPGQPSAYSRLIAQYDAARESEPKL